MDFSPAIVFDEEDRAREERVEAEKGEKKPWLKRIQYVVFG
jgi:amino acid transporter